MTLLFFDGFDGVNQTVLWSMSGMTSATGRFGVGRSMQSTGGNTGFTKTGFTPSGELIVGWAAEMPYTSQTFFTVYEAGVVHLTFTAGTSGQIAVNRGGVTNIATSANGVIPPGYGWFYIEIRMKIADSGGEVEIRLNGSPTPIINYSGDTRNGGTAGLIDTIAWNHANDGNARSDDIYILNTVGSAPLNTFLGDVRIDALVPTGAGASTGLTPSTGSNWQNVDELPHSATDYNGSATPGARDTYALQDLTGGTGVVYAISVHSSMHKSDAGLGQMKPAIKSGSNVYYGATQVLGTSAALYIDTWTQDPNTSTAWTATTVNALEAGAEVV